MGEGRELQLLTNSKRSCFLRCPRKFYLKYELCRVPLRTSEALSLGTLVHAALEAWWSGNCLRLNDIRDDTAESSDYSVHKAMAMYNGYNATYDYAARNERYEIIAVEAEYRAPLLNPKTGKTSRTWLLAGKIDAIAKEPFGRIIIVEHKTTSDSVAPESNYWRKLTLDGQVSGYSVGAAALGYKADYCLYDVLAKPKHKPLEATPEDKRVYNKDGRLSARCREVGETPDEYGQRVFNAIMEEPEKYYARREVVRLDSEIEGYYRDMWAVGLMIRACQLDNTWPHNGDACNEFGGCEYFDVCTKCANINDDTRFMSVDDSPELGGG